MPIDDTKTRQSSVLHSLNSIKETVHMIQIHYSPPSPGLKMAGAGHPIGLIALHKCCENGNAHSSNSRHSAFLPPLPAPTHSLSILHHAARERKPRRKLKGKLLAVRGKKALIRLILCIVLKPPPACQRAPSWFDTIYRGLPGPFSSHISSFSSVLKILYFSPSTLFLFSFPLWSLVIDFSL